MYTALFDIYHPEDNKMLLVQGGRVYKRYDMLCLIDDYGIDPEAFEPVWFDNLKGE